MRVDSLAGGRRQFWGGPRLLRVLLGLCFRDIEKCVELCRSTRTLFRSEEHTSELQSPYDLVCRLLLEKKNKTIIETILIAGQVVLLYRVSARTALVRLSAIPLPLADAPIVPSVFIITMHRLTSLSLLL